MMQALVIAGDVAGSALLLSALVVLLASKTAGACAIKNMVECTAVATVICLLYPAAASIVEGIWPAAEPYLFESYVEILFPVLAVVLVYSAYSARQLADVRSTQRALVRSHEMTMGIIDAAPAGILFLDPTGRITFANETARQVLDLAEDPHTGRLVGPDWTVIDDRGAQSPGFCVLVEDESVKDLPLTVQWPTGWSVELDISTEPLRDAREGLGGVVATFERPARLRPA